MSYFLGITDLTPYHKYDKEEGYFFPLSNNNHYCFKNNLFEENI